MGDCVFVASQQNKAYTSSPSTLGQSHPSPSTMSMNALAENITPVALEACLADFIKAEGVTVADEAKPILA